MSQSHSEIFPESPIPSPPPPASQSKERPQSQRIYSGLLSNPEFDAVDFDYTIKLSRNIKLTNTYQYFSINDVLTFGPKPRTTRRTNRKWKRENSSRRSRTFQARLEQFRPVLENKASSLPEWSQFHCFKDIRSISTMSLPDLDDEGLSSSSVPFVWDHRQGLGFREYPTPVVLIGYTVKLTPVDVEKVDRLCSNIGVLPLPLKSWTKSYLFLEDHTAKIRLCLSRQSNVENLRLSQIVSGIPICIKGISSGGKFWVDDVLYATLPAPELPLKMYSDGFETIFVSGLHVGRQDTNWGVVHLLFEYLQCLCGSVVEQENILFPRTRVFFLGNLFCRRDKIKWNLDEEENFISKECEIVNMLDNCLENTAQTMEVFIIPGENDPTHQSSLPQPSLHKQLFRTALTKPNFHTLPNPVQVQIPTKLAAACAEGEDLEEMEDDFLSMVLTSGTNVKETMEHCEITCPIEMCTKLLEWSHLLPTSVADNEIAEEIFSLKHNLPNLFVLGGLKDFSVTDWNGVKIVAVPTFASSGTAIALTKNCDILPLSFKISSGSSNV